MIYDTKHRYVEKREKGMRRSAFAYRIQNIKRHWLLLVMVLPGIIYLFINNYLPMFGIIIAFKNVNFAKGIWGSDWVGFDNFAYLFQTQDAWVITRNTLLYNGAFIVLGTILSVAVAVLLNEVRKRFVSRLYQSIILLPYLISMVIVAYLVLALLNEENGFINHYVLPWLGIDSVSWYADAGKWPYILSVVYLWKNVGYTCIVYLASIVGISQEYYESATLDGASKWRQVWSITLPLIKPTMVILVLLSVGRIFNSDFGLFYQVPLNSGALQTTTDVIDIYVYRGLMTFGDFGMSSAAGLYQSIVGFLLVLTTNAFVRRKDKDLALF